jgi:hypothetical protein
MFFLEKKGMRLFICGSYADASDQAVFSVATINKKKKKKKDILFTKNIHQILDWDHRTLASS